MQCYNILLNFDMKILKQNVFDILEVIYVDMGGEYIIVFYKIKEKNY